MYKKLKVPKFNKKPEIEGQTKRKDVINTKNDRH